MKKYTNIDEILRDEYIYDPMLYNHSVNVSKLTKQIAIDVGYTGNLDELVDGALIHDVGKLLVDPNILKKNGKLTDAEFQEVKKHPEYAKKLLDPMYFTPLQIEMCLYHHEREDGSGYPYGLHSTQIPRSAKILSVADVYEALLSDRCYKKAYPPDAAFDILMMCTHNGLFEPSYVYGEKNIYQNLMC